MTKGQKMTVFYQLSG